MLRAPCESAKRQQHQLEPSLNSILRFGARAYVRHQHCGWRPGTGIVCYLLHEPPTRARQYGLRPPQILPGLACNPEEPSTAEQVALDTLRVLVRDHLTGDVPAGAEIGLSHGRFGFSNATSIPSGYFCGEG